MQKLVCGHEVRTELSENLKSAESLGLWISVVQCVLVYTSAGSICHLKEGGRNNPDTTVSHFRVAKGSERCAIRLILSEPYSMFTHTVSTLSHSHFMLPRDISRCVKWLLA